MVYLKPAPVVARVATCMPKLRTPIEGWEAGIRSMLDMLAPAPDLRTCPTRRVEED
jgi:hypothetical protein